MQRPAKPEEAPRRPAAVGELALVDRIRQRASETRNSHVRLGIGDDCAILRPGRGEELLVTTDFSLEGRHFRRDWHPPASVGHRTLARGLSDIASMGGRPLAAFLSLALPRSIARHGGWLDGFLDGLLTLAAQYRVPLAGGDTSGSPSDHILADIVLLGSAPQGRAMRRSGARPGDFLYCTGALGGAAAELGQLSLAPRRFRSAAAGRQHPHLFPAPRLSTGQALLRRRLASACVDISDGLSTDLAHLCDASGVAAEINAASLPLHPLTQKLGPENALNAALHGGEDYELLFSARPAVKLPRSLGSVAITRIGRILARRRGQPRMVLLRDGRRIALEAKGWEHLR